MEFVFTKKEYLHFAKIKIQIVQTEKVIFWIIKFENYERTSRV
jgi:hypothetical protein